MAKTIPHRELRNNSSRILRDVASGETVEISNHGEVVAVLVPPPRGPNAPLRVRKAARLGGFAQLPRERRHQPTAEILDDLRGDR